MTSTETPSIYNQHFTNPEQVAKCWSHILENNLGVSEVSGCCCVDPNNNNNIEIQNENNNNNSGARENKNKANFNITPTSQHTCALPQGWTVDFCAAVSDDEENNNTSDSSFVLKSIPPQTRVIKNHPTKGDCLVAKENISAGTTLVTETSLLSAPHDPALFQLAASSAKSIESRSYKNKIVSRAASAAASFIRLCYSATSEDVFFSSSNPQQQSKNYQQIVQATISNDSSSSQGGSFSGTGGTASSFALFRSMAPQWTASLIFNTLMNIGLKMTSSSFLSSSAEHSSSSNNSFGSCVMDVAARLQEFGPGFEICSEFSGCSCGGNLLDLSSLSNSNNNNNNTVRIIKTPQEEEQEKRDFEELSNINEFRSLRWSEWTGAAKVIHRLCLKFLPFQQQQQQQNSNNNNNKNPKQSNVVVETTLSKIFQALNSTSSTKNNLSDESLCALALEINGFMSASFLQSLNSSSSTTNATSNNNLMTKNNNINNNNNIIFETKSAGQISKPALRLAYFFDALASNAIEVSVPGVPKRLAVFSYSRLIEHECRPSCSVSFFDSPTLHGSCSFLAGTQVQWDDPIHGCLVSGGIRQENLIKKELKKLEKSKLQEQQENNKNSSAAAASASAATSSTKSKQESSSSSSSSYIPNELKHEKSAAGHPIKHYGGANPINIILIPAIICISAVRDINRSEPVSIAYVGSVLMTRHERQRELISKYGFRCGCIWCVGFAPDLARAFRCPQCPRGAGVICPRADGSQLSLWECIQCGFHPDVHYIDRACDSEKALIRVKADSISGLQKLVEDEYLHYSHALVCRKLDNWAERAWRQQQADTCISVVEVLLRCIDRLGNDDIDGFAAVLRKQLIDENNNNNTENAEKENNSAASAASSASASAATTTNSNKKEKEQHKFIELPTITENRAERRGPARWDKNPPRDTLLAQYLELLGKANHAIGNAHTARYYYGTALAIRERSGQSLSWWCRATRFMAVTKSLADLMDSK